MTVTDRYYHKEDEIETPEAELDNFRAQLGATSAVTTYVNSSMEAFTTTATELYNDAEARGDETSKQRIVELHGVATHLKDTVLYSNEAQKGILAAAAKIAERKQKAESELGSLLEAMDNYEVLDPRLEKFANSIEEGVYEFISYNEVDNGNAPDDDAADPDSSDYDNIVADLCKTIRRMSPSTTNAVAERFFATLIGDFEMNDIQRGLFLSLLATINVEVDAS